MISQQIKLVSKKNLYLRQPQKNRIGGSSGINICYKLRQVTFLGFSFFLSSTERLNKKTFYPIPYSELTLNGLTTDSQSLL